MNVGNKRRVFINSGERFGKLVVIGESSLEERPLCDNSHVYYKCRCDCGNIKIVRSANLKRKHNVSCGCQKKISGTKNIQQWISDGGINPNREFVGQISGALWCHIKNNAKERNHKIDITKEYIWELFLKQNGKCALTGLKLKLSPLSINRYDNDASLDRIDSKIGYVIGNVQWVHKDVNFMKMDFPEDYFVKMCKLVSINK
jgi:hypothetical protein